MRRNVEPVTPVTKGFIMKSQYAKAKQTSLEWEEGEKKGVRGRGGGRGPGTGLQGSNRCSMYVYA